MTDQPCDRCNGTAIDPEHSGVEHYGDGIVRPVPEPCNACQTPRHCSSCGHQWDSHDTNADGNRSCRSVGHPKGVSCTDCRAMLTTEYRQQLQDERDADWFQAVWGAYTVTLADARDAFGTSADAFFSDIHQSALASALIAYRKQRVDELKADWSRYRGRVLQEAWEALRDAQDGPLIDGMNVINKLLEKK